ncbi:hypothetical protein PsYK624_130140 [Phanerochaete sordida]|uniref:Uncharacterized protein n=1 Tax=Phanerochaete sordida TaxID=48140 RepID=A0A9P3LJ24_9APHY|nr:hypothetical protein PsYK624_130140 [Phanerochaete sordida]
MAHEMRELAAIIMAARVPNSLAGMDVRGNLRRLDETIDRMEFQAQAALRECTTSEDEQSKLRDTIRSCDRLITLTQSLLGIISQLQECSRSLSRKQAYSGVGSILRASRVSDGAIRDVTEALSSAVASFEKASANIIGIIKDRVRSDIENIRDSQEMHLQYLIAGEHVPASQMFS